MNRTKTTFAILALTLALTSCQKTYNCVCVYRPGVMQVANTPRYDISAGSTSQAIKKCDKKDENKSFDCTIQ